MGRAASHVTLECALRTRPQVPTHTPLPRPVPAALGRPACTPRPCRPSPALPSLPVHGP